MVTDLGDDSLFEKDSNKIEKIIYSNIEEFMENLDLKARNLLIKQCHEIYESSKVPNSIHINFNVLKSQISIRAIQQNLTSKFFDLISEIVVSVGEESHSSIDYIKYLIVQNIADTYISPEEN